MFEWPGSNGPAGCFIQSVPGVIDSKTCLLPMVTEQSRGFLQLHLHYKNNILPFKDGLLNQPNIYIKFMELIERNAK